MFTSRRTAGSRVLLLLRKLLNPRHLPLQHQLRKVPVDIATNSGASYRVMNSRAGVFDFYPVGEDALLAGGSMRVRGWGEAET